MTMDQYTSLDELVASPDPFHVWMAEYTVTHDCNMVIAVHRGDLPERVELRARGCRYWRGPLQGGPYRLAMERTAMKSAKREWTEIRLYDRDGAFELVCESVDIAAYWPGPAGVG